LKILLTGGAGFVGSNLISRLQEIGGYEVVVFDNEILGKRDFISDLRHEFVHGDIRDSVAVKRAMDGVDAVVHLAADTRVIPSIANPSFNMDVNVQGSFNILEAMRETGVSRLVNASTGGAIMGEVEPPVHEEMTPHPASPYGASKLAVEGYCSAFSASYGMSCVSLRFSNVYGPRSFHKGSVIAHFMKQLLNDRPLEVFGDGTQTRDFVHVRDLSDGIVAALQNRASGVLQLGTGRPTPVNEIITLLEEVTGLRPNVVYREFRAGEVRHTWCKIDRARGAIGYDPGISLREGLGDTWRWFLDNRSRFEES
jgi:UDP-glucose 4-epimerase